jgi:hypothetical protein
MRRRTRDNGRAGGEANGKLMMMSLAGAGLMFAQMTDKHTLAIISIVGSSLDVVGSLYLSYDLLGGEHGPLRTLTRAVTYGMIFGVGYGLPLGFIFGLAGGLAHGVTLSVEFSRVSRQRPRPGFWFEAAMSAIRGCGYGIGSAYLFGARFGITFGILSTVGQVVGYQFGVRPSMDYRPSTRPRMTMPLFLAVINRTVGYALAGYVSALVAHQREGAMAFGLKVGLLVGVVSGIVTFLMPYIEWRADNMPVRRMGVIGVAMILIGFALQSVQYFVTLIEAGVK